MAGNTAIIDSTTLRVQWDSYLPMGAICQHWTITVHQLVRLRMAWGLPPRNDRKRRYKPSRAERMLDPSREELEVSEDTLDLAPMVAERVTSIQATWSDEVRAERLASTPEPFRLCRVEVPEELRDIADSQSRWYE